MAGAALTALFAYLFIDLTIVALPVESATIVGLSTVAMFAWLLWQQVVIGKRQRNFLAPSPVHTGVLAAVVLAHIAATSFSIAPMRAIEQMTTLAMALAVYLMAIQLAAVLPRGACLGALRNASWIYVASTALDALKDFGPGYRPPAPNTIAIIFSLGMLIPWSMIRMARYVAESTEFLQDRIESINAMAQADRSAVGEEIGDMFDLDLGL